jgi:hypothetical protein
MKLQHLFEAKSKINYDEKYTREDNPEVYEFSDPFYPYFENLSQEDFKRLPKKLKYVGDDNCAFVFAKCTMKSFVGFPEIIADLPISVTIGGITACENITSLEGLPEKIDTLHAARIVAAEFKRMSCSFR